MKPLKRKNYGSIPHLSTSKLGSGDYFIGHGQENILTHKTRDKYDEILVFEKYDGSNVGVAKLNNKIYALTRSGYEAKTSKYIQHIHFSNWVIKNEGIFKSILQDGERITGEWLMQAHGLKYLITEKPIIFFDHFNCNSERSNYDFLKSICNNYGLQQPRLLHRGIAISVNKLIPKLNLKTDFCESLDNPEGMIYRVERDGKVDFLAKWVRHDFEAGKYIIGKTEDELIWNLKQNDFL